MTGSHFDRDVNSPHWITIKENWTQFHDFAAIARISLSARCSKEFWVSFPFLNWFWFDGRCFQNCGFVVKFPKMKTVFFLQSIHGYANYVDPTPHMKFYSRNVVLFLWYSVIWAEFVWNRLIGDFFIIVKNRASQKKSQFCVRLQISTLYRGASSKGFSGA